MTDECWELGERKRGRRSEAGNPEPTARNLDPLTHLLDAPAVAGLLGACGCLPTH